MRPHLLLFFLLALIIQVSFAQDTSDPCKRYNCTGWVAPEVSTNSDATTTTTTTTTTTNSDTSGEEEEYIPTYCLEESTKKARAYIVDVYDQFCDYKYPDENRLCTATTTFNADLNYDLIYGVCKEEDATVDLGGEIRYPGEYCDETEELYRCAFGYKRCAYNRCVGKFRDDTCDSSRDCEPGLYCKSGTCSLYELEGNSCNDQYACGRTMRCFYGDLGENTFTSDSGTEEENEEEEEEEETSARVLQSTGVCTKFFTVPNGQYVNTNTDTVNHYMCSSGAAVSNFCSTAIKGSKTGDECDVDEDCETNSLNTYTECSCTNAEDGLTYCGPGRGNSEWISAKDAFIEYLAATRSCHVSRSYTYHCDERVAHAAYMCKYLKASEYHEYYKIPECLKGMANDNFLPIVAEIEYYCNYLFSSVLALISLPFLLVSIVSF